MRAKYCLFILIASLSLLGIGRVCNADGLRMKFYHKSCRQAEKIVKDIIATKVNENRALGAKLLRMHFHDCFVRGCDGSILLDAVNNSTQSEKDAIPNRTLSGFDVIEEIKNATEKACPRVVSCADILALAARDSVSVPFGRNLWEVPTGRRDGRVSLASEVNGNIPSPFADFNTLLQIFQKKGLEANDLVVLSGAHTIGVAHCGTFSRRLYNFTGKGDQDPSLDPTYAESLKKRCPNPANPATTVEMDPKSSRSFDKHYFKILLQNKGLFQSDAALLTNTSSAALVRQLWVSNSFLAKFAISMKKLGAVEVLLGNAGEIRKQCHVANS